MDKKRNISRRFGLPLSRPPRLSFIVAAVFSLALLFPSRLPAQDTDGDGVTDAIETELGSAPDDAAITPRLLPSSSSLQWNHFIEMIWTGSEYLNVWSQCQNATCDYKSADFSTMMRRLDRFGKPVGRSHVIDRNMPVGLNLAWTGSSLWINRYGCISPTILLSIVDDRGNKILPDVENVLGRIVWTGSELGAFDWTSSDFRFLLRRYNDQAVFQSSHLIVDSIFPYTGAHEVVWTGSEYGVAPTNGSFYRISADGRLITTTELQGHSGNTKMAWTGSEFVFSSNHQINADGSNCEYWKGPCENKTFFQRLDSEGNPAGTMQEFATIGESELHDPENSADSMIWTGSHIGITSQDFSSNTDSKCNSNDCTIVFWLHWLMPDGRQIGPSVSVDSVPSMLYINEIQGPDFMYILEKNNVYELVKLDPDSDGDGIPDNIEIGSCLSPHDYDTDSDGVIDSLEDPDADGLLGADDPGPCSEDVDGDGLEDADEISIGTSPITSDSDDDGLTDGEEANTEGTDPLESDSDMDGLDDGVEIGTYGTDPLNPNTDGDKWTDGEEITRGSNPLKKPAADGGSSGGAGCSLSSAGDNTGVEIGFLLPLLIGLAVTRAHRRLRG